jgi:aminoglycoside phosphotransferase (APT) family kinase protein
LRSISLGGTQRNQKRERVATKRMHEGEVDIDVELVRRLLVAQFPQWCERPVEAVQSTGTVNAIYRLGDDLCIRLPRIQTWASDLEKELRWLPRLAPHLSLAVPEPVAKGDPGAGYPFTWAIYRWLDGETFAGDRVGDEREAAADLAQFVVELRRIDPAGAPHSPSHRSLLVRDPHTRAVIESLRGVIDTDAATTAWEMSLRAPPWDGRPVWTHGDLLPPNLLVEGGRLSAVIDFGGVGVGDPAFDVIPAWSVCSDEGRDTFRGDLDVDDATWARGRGFALHQALLIIPYYPETSPEFVAMATRTVENVLADSDA